MDKIANIGLTAAMLFSHASAMLPKTDIIPLPITPGCQEFWANPDSTIISESKDGRRYFYFNINNIFGSFNSMVGNLRIYTAFTAVRGRTYRVDIPVGDALVTGVAYRGSMGQLDSLTETQAKDALGNIVWDYQTYQPEIIEPAVITFIPGNVNAPAGQLVQPSLTVHGEACASPAPSGN